MNQPGNLCSGVKADNNDTYALKHILFLVSEVLKSEKYPLDVLI